MYLQQNNDDQPMDDIMDLVQQIVSFHMKVNLMKVCCLMERYFSIIFPGVGVFK